MEADGGVARVAGEGQQTVSGLRPLTLTGQERRRRVQDGSPSCGRFRRSFSVFAVESGALISTFV